MDNAALTIFSGGHATSFRMRDILPSVWVAIIVSLSAPAQGGPPLTLKAVQAAKVTQGTYLAR